MFLSLVVFSYSVCAFMTLSPSLISSMMDCMSLVCSVSVSTSTNFDRSVGKAGYMWMASLMFCSEKN